MTGEAAARELSATARGRTEVERLYDQVQMLMIELDELVSDPRFERLDVETLHYVVQCKLVQALSLEALTQLAEEVERLGHQAGKIGIVAVKVRRGAGRRSPVLYVQTEAMWRAQHGEGTG